MKKKISIMKKKINQHPFDINGGKTIYIKDSKFMEFVDEMATQLTELNFHEDTFIAIQSDDEVDEGYRFTDDAQDFYNERYDEVETMVNNLMGVYRWSTLPINIFGTNNKLGKKS